MFDSLSDQMKHDLDEQIPRSRRILEYVLVVIVAMVIFVGLYMAMGFLNK